MKLIKFFDNLEDMIRKYLSRHPRVYALVGSIGIILLWRGVWHIADDLDMSGSTSAILGIVILLFTGLFVSFFVGEQILINGIKEEKRIDEKTAEEIRSEEVTLSELHEDVEEIKKNTKHLKKSKK